MFSALDARGALVDATVLDLYAGTGALAIEALSRGASRAVFVERDRRGARRDRARTSTTLGFGDRGPGRARPTSAAFLAGPPPPEAPFDLVFADPPYDTADDDGRRRVVDALGGAGLARADGASVVRRAAGRRRDRRRRELPSHVGAHVRGYARRLPRTRLTLPT